MGQFQSCSLPSATLTLRAPNHRPTARHGKTWSMIVSRRHRRTQFGKIVKAICCLPSPQGRRT